MPSRYVYHANALGLGGVLISGDTKTIIPSLASVTLSQSGGEGFAMARDYNANGIAFSSMESRVVGAEIGDQIFTTFAEVFITNFTAFDRLNIPRLRIALMNAQLTSTRNVKKNETEFEIRARFAGVNINGEDVEALIDAQLCNTRTFDDAVDHLSGKADDRKALRSAGQVRGSLVKGWSRDLVPKGRPVPVKGLGHAHFGEFTFKRGLRHINLVRIELAGGFPVFKDVDSKSVALAKGGSSDGGEYTMGSLEGNGTPPDG